MNTLENLSLFDINDLYQLQDQHFQQIISKITVEKEPYQHFEIQGIFHSDFYKFVKMLMPEFEDMDSFRSLPGVPAHYPQQRYAFFIKTSDQGHDYMFKKIVNPKMRYNYVRLYQWFDQVLCRQFFKVMDLNIRDKTHDEFAYMVDVPGFSLTAHTDIPQKVMTVLCYMPDDDTIAHAGTNILVPKNTAVLTKPAKVDDDFDIVKTTKFLPNNTFCFRRSDYSFHNVVDNNVQGQRKFLLFTAMTVKKT